LDYLKMETGMDHGGYCPRAPLARIQICMSAARHPIDYGGKPVDNLPQGVRHPSSAFGVHLQSITGRRRRGK
jgi:hypothetical protein